MLHTVPLLLFVLQCPDYFWTLEVQYLLQRCTTNSPGTEETTFQKAPPFWKLPGHSHCMSVLPTGTMIFSTIPSN